MLDIFLLLCGVILAIIFVFHDTAHAIAPSASTKIISPEVAALCFIKKV
jgi:phosphate/sulfate permease